MYSKLVRWYFLMILCYNGQWSDYSSSSTFVQGTRIVFNNLQCHSTNKTLFRFQQCQIKLQKRGYSEVNIYGKMTRSIDNITVRAELFRKTNGYTPFIYKFTMDFCELKRYPQRQPVMTIFFRYLERNSNLNHTCPYDHDIILKNFVMPDEVLRLLPYPKGDYMVQLEFAIYNTWLVDVKAFAQIVD